jgi:hypothetical protein
LRSTRAHPTADVDVHGIWPLPAGFHCCGPQASATRHHSFLSRFRCGGAEERRPPWTPGLGSALQPLANESPSPTSPGHAARTDDPPCRRRRSPPKLSPGINAASVSALVSGEATAAAGRERTTTRLADGSITVSDRIAPGRCHRRRNVTASYSDRTSV